MLKSYLFENDIYYHKIILAIVGIKSNDRKTMTWTNLTAEKLGNFTHKLLSTKQLEEMVASMKNNKIITNIKQELLS